MAEDHVPNVARLPFKQFCFLISCKLPVKHNEQRIYLNIVVGALMQIVPFFWQMFGNASEFHVQNHLSCFVKRFGDGINLNLQRKYKAYSRQTEYWPEQAEPFLFA